MKFAESFARQVEGYPDEAAASVRNLAFSHERHYRDAIAAACHRPKVMGRGTHASPGPRRLTSWYAFGRPLAVFDPIWRTFGHFTMKPMKNQGY